MSDTTGIDYREYMTSVQGVKLNLFVYGRYLHFFFERSKCIKILLYRQLLSRIIKSEVHRLL